MRRKLGKRADGRTHARRPCSSELDVSRTPRPQRRSWVGSVEFWRGGGGSSRAACMAWRLPSSCTALARAARERTAKAPSRDGQRCLGARSAQLPATLVTHAARRSVVVSRDPARRA
eukprot:291713-Chlamydomonas_euryale.AAC.8